MRGHSFVRLFKRDSREPLRYFAVVAVAVFIILVVVVLVVLIFLIALVILVVLVINVCSGYCWESKQ